MTQTTSTESNQKSVPVPQWIHYFTDEQFVLWCKQRKLYISSSVRAFPEDEREAIFRYMVRQRLVN